MIYNDEVIAKTYIKQEKIPFEIIKKIYELTPALI